MMTTYVIEEGKEKEILLRIIENTYSYLEIERNIIKSNLKILDVIILNQYKNIMIFLVYYDKVIIVSPYIPIKENITIRTCNIERVLGQCNSNTYYVFDLDTVSEILKAPKVLLINYSNNSKFTIPRLNLSTHTLAAFLRENKLARVYIIDMQFDLSDQDVINEIIIVKPNIIGLSINYGFFDKSINFLDLLYKIIKSNNLNVNILLGNIIPSLNYKDYIERYNNIVISYAEGEIAINDYVDYVNNKKNLEEVSGIYYYSHKKI